MSDEQSGAARRPFGERDENERQQPLGSRAFPHRPPSRQPDHDAEAPLSAPEEAVGEEWEEAPDKAPVESDLPDEADPLPAPDKPPVPETEPRIPAVFGQRRSAGVRPAAAPREMEPEPPLYDEPADAPITIRARDRRQRVPGDESVLKASPAPQPESAAAAAAPPVVADQPPLVFGVVLRSMITIFAVAALIATLFTWWTPNSFLPSASVEQLSVALATQSGFAVAPLLTPTPLPPPTDAPPPPLRVGVVSGHRGLHPSTGLPDPGAMCPDGLTEAEINEAVASRVSEWLRGHGYEVDVFDEFDPRLDGYQAAAMVSIHADSCEYINDFATGFKVASFSESATPDEDARLVRCLIDRYANTTGLAFHPSVTFDMTQYHTFREVAPGTPGAIIEVGFMYLDRELLTENTDVVALGVARGLLCFLRDEPIGAVDLPPPIAPGEPPSP